MHTSIICINELCTFATLILAEFVKCQDTVNLSSMRNNLVTSQNFCSHSIAVRTLDIKKWNSPLKNETIKQFNISFFMFKQLIHTNFSNKCKKELQYMEIHV